MEILSDFRYKIGRWWHSFHYNFHWENYGFLFSGHLARGAAFVPLFGYLIIFNDGVAEYLTFHSLSGSHAASEMLSSQERLRFVYFGLIFLGVAETVYIVFRPYVIKMGSDFYAYKHRIMSLASPSYFIRANGIIRNSGFDPYTRGGKYYDREYEDFIEICTGARPGSSIKDAYESGKAANWDEAAKRYEPLLTGIIQEIYFREGRTRRPALLFAIGFAFTGYLFLFIPSFELFCRILAASFARI